MQKAIKTANGWILCGCCGKKLARIIDEKVKAVEVNSEDFVRGLPKFNTSGITIEFKCSGCKSLNEYEQGAGNDV